MRYPLDTQFDILKDELKIRLKMKTEKQNNWFYYFMIYGYILIMESHLTVCPKKLYKSAAISASSSYVSWDE